MIRSLYPILLFCFTAFSMRGYAQLPGYVPSSGLLAYYGFNSTSNDLSGNGNHGTLSGPGYTTDRYGNSSAAVNFTGSGERITTQKIDRSAVNDFSYSVWVNPTDTTTIPALGSGNGMNSWSSRSCIIAAVNGWNWSPTATDVAAGLNVAANGLWVCEHGPSITNVALVWSGTLTGWHHIVIVYTSKQPTLYIDGALTTTGLVSGYNVHPSMACDSFFQAGPVPYPYITAGFGHGLYPIAVPTYNFKGKIDDIAIYGRSITPCEVTRLYDTTTAPPVITGTTTLCSGATALYTSSATGGYWSSSDGGIATIGSATGIVSGITSGTATLRYAYSSGCMASQTISINAVPAISGYSTLCLGGATSTLTNPMGGGVWLSSDTSVATIDSTTGVMTAVSLGTATITYLVTSTCFTTTSVFVTSTIPPITGSLYVCTGLTTALSDSLWGGVWSSTGTSVLSIDTGGVVTGISTGIDTVMYTFGGTCIARAVVTVSTAPPAITGLSSICSGTSTALTNPWAGGTWTSSSMTLATIGTASGIVSGVSAGTVILSYTIATGCSAIKLMTVVPVPSSISGSVSGVCVGATAWLSSSPSGGVWSSAGPGIATVGSTGLVTGVSAGTTNITYTLGGICIATKGVTVNPLPAVITGSYGLCAGSTTTLISTTSGGIWASSSPAIAVIGSATGIVHGSGVGIANITYTASGCRRVQAVTVYVMPTPIYGSTNLCTGMISALVNGVTGGIWTSGSPTVATIGSISGDVTGMSVGASTISYTLPTGCATSTIVTVNISPASISGINTVCAGMTTALYNTVTGGTWSSSNPSVAAVDILSGIVTGVSGGVANITYTMPGGGCMATMLVTVNAVPSAISGISNTCIGGSVTLSASGGGSWSSASPAVAAVGSSSGVVTGLASGTAVISYSSGPGCTVVRTVTIGLPPAAITGTAHTCSGQTTVLSNAVPGGVWGTASATVATVGSSTGIVTGIASGTAIISYSTAPGTSCSATTVVTIDPLPAPVTGMPYICAGQTSAMVSGSGGMWSSGMPSVASVGSATGVVSGLSVGIAGITYTLPTGCYSTTAVTVNPSPVIISGSAVFCVGGSAVFTGSGGGFWTSSNLAVADVNILTGLVGGVSAGTATITYTISTGCYATKSVTVTSSPGAISGSLSVCLGSTTLLTDATPGGTWLSGAPGIAAVGSGTGMVTAVAAGMAMITYSLGAGCFTTAVVTVNPSPAGIGGISSLCVGLSGTVTHPAAGGSWSVSNTNAAIGSASGLVTGITAGTAIITYTLSAGCFATRMITINTSPGAIAGTAQVCSGGMTTFSNPTPGGVWSSSSPGVATIGSGTGIVAGIAAGTATVTYSLGAGCVVTRVVTVNPLPAAITGPTNVCAGSMTTLSSGTTGGTWSTGAATAAIGSLTGIVTGISPGTALITYTAVTSCIRTAAVTVNALPAPVTGPSAVCVGAAITETSTPGGLWTSSVSFVATVGSSTGVVTGIATGATMITYTLPTGCRATKIITVSPLPTAIIGASAVCTGSSTTLTDAMPGGWWSCSSAHVSVGSLSGVVTGVATGTTLITYSLGTGCTVTRSMTVFPSPSPISGAASMCAGTATTLTDATSGGTWSSSSTGIAAVGLSTGIVSGISAGVVTITYTIGPTGCMASRSVTVNASPAAILGPASVCTGSFVTETNTVPGGVWSSGSSLIAVGSLTGAVTGISGGVASVTYTIGVTGSFPGCFVSRPISVNVISPVSGSGYMCAGSATTLVNTTPGGIWSSSATMFVTIGSATGIAAGVASGTANITYTVGATGCTATKALTVYAAPSAISGPPSVCTGSSVTETNAIPGGVWSTTAAILSIGPSTGVVAGLSVGAAMITYSIGTCSVSKTITVNAIAPVTGTAGICAGSSTTYTNATAGGTWTSSAPAVASIGSVTGLITALAPGTVTITYTLPSGCMAAKTMTVTTGPPPITGTPYVCIGSTTLMSNTVSGGVWSGSSSVAHIGSATGIVTGLSASSATITYSIGPGCAVTRTVTVRPLPAAITGASSLCIGNVSTYTDAIAGGVWSSSTSSVATIGSTTGTVSAAGAGTTVISYTLPTGCRATRTITVNAGPLPITGSAGMCVGNTSLLSNAATGGSWSSGSTGIATVGAATGLVAGISAGTANITYTIGSGCRTTRTVTVTAPPSAITGTTLLCTGAMTTMSSTTPGGTWSSSNTSVATAALATGLVIGISAGTAMISYTTGPGCSATKALTINLPPSAIGGTAVVCVGSAVSLSNTSPGGIWSSSNPIIASVGTATGIVTGLNTGTSNISYTTGTGCMATRVVTVNPPPAGISGSSNVCAGQTISLSNPIPGGTWSTGSAGIATVGTSGIVTGVSSGVAAITYAISAGCRTTRTVTVNSVLPITGLHNLCAWGDTVTVHSATAGGVFTSSLVTVTNLGGGMGRVMAFAPGTGTVTYTSAMGCSTTRTVTVNPLPSPIYGAMNVCTGAATALFNTTGGGTWTSGSSTIATIGSSTGVVSGISAGTALITYSLSTGCSIDTPVNVHPLPVGITGWSSTVIIGTSTPFSCATPGGVWSSSNPAVAAIGISSGMLTGISAGVVTITYTTGAGCPAVLTLTVIPAPLLRPGSNEAAGVQLQVSPNPNNGKFTVRGIWGKPGSERQEEVEVWIEVMSVQGQKVHSEKIPSINGAINAEITLSDALPPGMYFLQLLSADLRTVIPLIIQR